MRYRKKPVEIQAWQFSKKNFKNGVPSFIKENETVSVWSQYGGDVIGGEIKTLESNMDISEDDYIIQGIKGEFYPCKPDIFEATYEEVGE